MKEDNNNRFASFLGYCSSLCPIWILMYFFSAKLTEAGTKTATLVNVAGIVLILISLTGFYFRKQCIDDGTFTPLKGSYLVIAVILTLAAVILYIMDYYLVAIGVLFILMIYVIISKILSGN